MTPGPGTSMRDALLSRVHEAMRTDDTIFFLTADFGAPALDAMREEFGSRCINVGIAEQNLVNVAAGLALEGCTVFAFAIAPFLSMRCYEQIRTNLSLHSRFKELNVNLISVGAGISYDVSGPTHHCFEDLSMMRMLPYMEVISPSDSVAAGKAFDVCVNVKRPKYLRFDSKVLPNLYDENQTIDFHEGFTELRCGTDVCLAATGYMTHTALATAEILEHHQISTRVLDMLSLKNYNREALSSALGSCRCVGTLEEGFIGCGGLDTLIGHLLSDTRRATPLLRFGFNHHVFETGDRVHLHKLHQLDPQSIAGEVKGTLHEL